MHRVDSARCVVFAGEAEEDLQRLEHIGTGAILCVAHATSLLKVSGRSGHWQRCISVQCRPHILLIDELQGAMALKPLMLLCSACRSRQDMLIR